MSDEEKAKETESEPDKVGPEEPKFTWAKWDPVLAKKIIADNFEHFKRLTEDEKFKG
jgi:hypothetical protein